MHSIFSISFHVVKGGKHLRFVVSGLKQIDVVA